MPELNPITSLLHLTQTTNLGGYAAAFTLEHTTTRSAGNASTILAAVLEIVHGLVQRSGRLESVGLVAHVAQDESKDATHFASSVSGLFGPELLLSRRPLCSVQSKEEMVGESQVLDISLLS